MHPSVSLCSIVDIWLSPLSPLFVNIVYGWPLTLFQRPRPIKIDIILTFQETGVTAFAHFDEYVRIQRLEAFLSKFYKLIVHRTFYGYEDEGDQNDDQWEWYSDDEEDEDTTAKLEEDKLDEGTVDEIYTSLQFFSKKLNGAIHKLCERVYVSCICHALP